MIAFNRSLVCIDDRELRRAAFAKAEKLIRRLERIERDLENFESEDQQLYHNWFQLTFRVEIQQIQDAEAELRRLTHFHNWMVAEHHRLEISIAAAYKILKAEEDFYRTAAPDERVRIDRERAARESFLREMMDREYEKRRKREERAQKKQRAAHEASQELFREIEVMTDEEIDARLKHRFSALEWLVMIIASAEVLPQFLIWRRVWDRTSASMKNEFIRLMKHGHEVDIERMMSDIDARLEAAAGFGGKANAGNWNDQHDKTEKSGAGAIESEDSNSFEYGAPGSGHSENGEFPRSQSRGEREELIKIIYRKLVRKLHPDLNGARNHDSKAWQKAVWHRVQDAHERFDLGTLQRLYRLVLIRGRELEEVTMSEILQSHNWLDGEIRDLNLRVTSNRKAPAWGFSRRKDYGPLERRVVKVVMEDLHEITGELAEMRDQFEMLEALAIGELELEHGSSSRGRSAKTSKRRSTAEPRRKPKSRARRRR